MFHDYSGIQMKQIRRTPHEEQRRPVLAMGFHTFEAEEIREKATNM
jgi:hypothetical protein